MTRNLGKDLRDSQEFWRCSVFTNNQAYERESVIKHNGLMITIMMYKMGMIRQ